MVEVALAYVRAGWRVFPIAGLVPGRPGEGVLCSCHRGAECSRPGKHPLCRGSFNRAVGSPTLVAKYWTEHPAANVGLALEGSGVLVLDIDDLDALVGAEARLGPLPLSYRVTTGRGLHIYLARPSDRLYHRAPMELQPGVEVKQRSITAAGSRHPSGGWYTVVSNGGIEQLPVAWAETLFAGSQDARTLGMGAGAGMESELVLRGRDWCTETTALGAKALSGEVFRLAQADNGARRNQLLKSAFRLGQLLHRDVVPAEASLALQRTAFQIGLEPEEVNALVEETLEAGARRPRRM